MDTMTQKETSGSTLATHTQLGGTVFRDDQAFENDAAQSSTQTQMRFKLNL